MKIKKLQLKNGYKRFHNLTINLGENPKRIIALVGPNGCGKSSVLDGILYRNNIYGQIGNKENKDYKYHSLLQIPGFNYSNVIVDFVAGNYDHVRHLREQTASQNTIISFRSPYRYNSQVMVKQSQALSEIKNNDYGATTASDLDDKMTVNYRRLYVRYNNYLNKNDCKPSEAKIKIIGDLNASIKNCLEIEVFSIGDIESGQGTLYFKKKDHPKEFEFNVLSSGEKEVVDILLDLYVRQDDYNDTIFLFDEPELHVNTSIQKNLLIEINKLIGHNCQLWIATHSIGFLRALKENLKEDCDIIQFPKGTDWASTTQVLAPMSKTRKKWQEIFETALDDLTGLISPKQIIYCEGKDVPGANGMEKGLDAKVFNNIFNDYYHDTLFISSGGGTELDQRSAIAIALLTKVFSEIEILVLKDRDMASWKVVDENMRQLYLKNNDNNHRVLNRWEIENYLYDKEVLKAFSNKQGLVFDEAAYDAMAIDIVNDNVKDQTGKIKNICGLQIPISPDKFKENLSMCITDEMLVYKEL